MSYDRLNSVGEFSVGQSVYVGTSKKPFEILEILKNPRTGLTLTRVTDGKKPRGAFLKDLKAA